MNGIFLSIVENSVELVVVNYSFTRCSQDDPIMLSELNMPDFNQVGQQFSVVIGADIA